VKKLAAWAVVGLAVWWAVKDPVAAAHLVHGISGAFNSLANSLSTFASHA
jgi:hypothetical protein